MNDKTDDTGKGPFRPGEAPRRPHATIDVKATEIGRDGRDGGQAGAPAGEKPQAKRTALPPPEPTRQRWSGAWAARLADTLGASRAWALRLARSNTFLSHMAAGVAGAALTLAVGALLALVGTRGAAVTPDLTQRLTALEQALAQQSAALPADLAGHLAAADRRLSGLEQRATAVAELQRKQAKLAADAKALQARVTAPELTERISKLEAALAAVSADDKSGNAALAERLATRLADVERLSGQASEAKSTSARVERDLVGVKSEAASLRQTLTNLQGSVEDRILAKLAAFEGDLKAVMKTEGERVTNAQRVLLTLEIANLKRALDRGDSYTRELDVVRKAAGGTVDLAPLERSSSTGVPKLGALNDDFQRVANAAMDAESERADASVLDRLMSSARSIVRVRKAHYDADDTSAEATLGRMENALKDGNIGEVLAQGGRLPPKAALAAESWLRKLEARYAADRAIAEIEAALKASLAEQRVPGPEPKRLERQEPKRPEPKR